MLRLISSERFLIFTLFFTGILSRLFFLEKMQSHWDGPNYTLALLNYSFVEQTPSPPGYPLYIAIGWLFHQFISDPHMAILSVSAIFAGIGVIIFYLTGKIIFDRTTGIVSSMLFLSAPTVYYFGITANPYGILPTTSTLLALVVFMITKLNKKYGILLGLVFSISIGIRPQDVMFLFPLYILGLVFLKKKQRLLSLTGFSIFTLIWFLPTALLIGGIDSYLGYFIAFAQNDAKADLSLNRIYYILPIIIKGAYLTCGFGLLFLILLAKHLPQYIKKPKLLMTRKVRPYFLLFVFWIIPSLSFNLFVRSDHAAHQMAYISALILLCSYCIKRFSSNKAPLFILVIVILNLFTFFRDRDVKKTMPYVSQSFHYSEIQKNDIRLPAIVSFVNTYPSDQAMVIVDPEIFRPIMYYLKDYNVYAYSSLDTNTPRVVNSVHHSKNWHYNSFIDNKHIFLVPDNISKIIIIANNKQYKITGVNYERFTLARNALLYVLDSIPRTQYHFEVHAIKSIR